MIFFYDVVDGIKLFVILIGIFSGANFFPGGGCSVPADIALGIGMGVNALRHCRRRKARTVFSDPQLTGLEKRFEAQRYFESYCSLKRSIEKKNL